MSLKSEFQAAGVEYARRIDAKRESDRLAALALEARKAGNASAFAVAFEEALSRSHDDEAEES